MLYERYGKIVPIRVADSELRLGGDPAELTVFPTSYGYERGANFVICKVAPGHYRCVLPLLQVQEVHEHQLAQITPGASAADLNDDDYHGPHVV